MLHRARRAGIRDADNYDENDCIHNRDDGEGDRPRGLVDEVGF